jgi:hypothetical protein
MKNSAFPCALDQTLDRADSDVVLIVNGVPDNLSVLGLDAQRREIFDSCF